MECHPSSNLPAAANASHQVSVIQFAEKTSDLVRNPTITLVKENLDILEVAMILANLQDIVRFSQQGSTR